MPKSIIHINQHIIKHNQKTGNSLPTITVKQGKRNRYAKEVEIYGPSKVIYSPDNPLSCGARVWIETDSAIKLTDETTFNDIKEMMDGSGISSDACVV